MKIRRASETRLSTQHTSTESFNCAFMQIFCTTRLSPTIQNLERNSPSVFLTQLLWTLTWQVLMMKELTNWLVSNRAGCFCDSDNSAFPSLPPHLRILLGPENTPNTPSQFLNMVFDINLIWISLIQSSFAFKISSAEMSVWTSPGSRLLDFSFVWISKQELWLLAICLGDRWIYCNQ